MKTIVINKIIGNKWRARRAFTLIELLTVIAVIGVLAALLFPAFSAVKRHALINHAKAEMAQLETAIDNYKSVYGFYPPSNPNGSLINQLYFELEGTTNDSVKFITLDGSAQIQASDVNGIFGIGGFVNCNKPGVGEDAPKARDFLPDLKPNQVATYTTNPPPDVVNILVSSVGGPDASYQPLGLQGINPWRYNSSSPTNNPGSYDLWVQLSIANKKYLICNWTKQVQINSSLP